MYTFGSHDDQIQILESKSSQKDLTQSLSILKEKNTTSSKLSYVFDSHEQNNHSKNYIKAIIIICECL